MRDARKELATTKLPGGTKPISQAVFLRVIQAPGAIHKEVSDLFDFRRPRNKPHSNASAILNLTNKQHDAMYALAGCSDVTSVMSGVKKQVRDGIYDIYGIDKVSFSAWFKNRRVTPKKTPAQGSRSPATHQPATPLRPKQLPQVASVLDLTQIDFQDERLLGNLRKSPSEATMDCTRRLLQGNQLRPAALDLSWTPVLGPSAQSAPLSPVTPPSSYLQVATQTNVLEASKMPALEPKSRHGHCNVFADNMHSMDGNKQQQAAEPLASYPSGSSEVSRLYPRQLFPDTGAPAVQPGASGVCWMQAMSSPSNALSCDSSPADVAATSDPYEATPMCDEEHYLDAMACDCLSSVDYFGAPCEVALQRQDLHAQQLQQAQHEQPWSCSDAVMSTQEQHGRAVMYAQEQGFPGFECTSLAGELPSWQHGLHCRGSSHEAAVQPPLDQRAAPWEQARACHHAAAQLNAIAAPTADNDYLWDYALFALDDEIPASGCEHRHLVHAAGADVATSGALLEAPHVDTLRCQRPLPLQQPGPPADHVWNCGERCLLPPAPRKLVCAAKVAEQQLGSNSLAFSSDMHQQLVSTQQQPQQQAPGMWHDLNASFNWHDFDFLGDAGMEYDEDFGRSCV